jgi:hypothetical protein
LNQGENAQLLEGGVVGHFLHHNTPDFQRQSRQVDGILLFFSIVGVLFIFIVVRVMLLGEMGLLFSVLARHQASPHSRSRRPQGPRQVAQHPGRVCHRSKEPQRQTLVPRLGCWQKSLVRSNVEALQYRGTSSMERKRPLSIAETYDTAQGQLCQPPSSLEARSAKRRKLANDSTWTSSLASTVGSTALKAVIYVSLLF